MTKWGGKCLAPKNNSQTLPLLTVKNRLKLHPKNKKSKTPYGKFLLFVSCLLIKINHHDTILHILFISGQVHFSNILNSVSACKNSGHTSCTPY